MASTASSRLPPSSKPLDLEITILSAKHLKNINWRNNGDIKPYAVLCLDPDRRHTSKPDPAGCTKPVWNESFTVPIPNYIHDGTTLSVEILHSKPSETPNPLIGSVRIPLNDLLADLDGGIGTLVRKYELRRPSGRPQGKIALKFTLFESGPPPPPPNPYYYSTAPPPPAARDYRQYPPPPPSPYSAPFPPPPAPAPYGNYPDPYPGYYSGYYSQPPPPPQPMRQYYDRPSGFGGPSAPVDYSAYDQKQRGGVGGGEGGSKIGIESGAAVGAVAEAMGGLKLGKGVNRVTLEDKYGVEIEESDLVSNDGGYSHYRKDY